MEPRHHCRGNRRHADDRDHDHRASMEPRHHCRGNTDLVRPPGASAKLQWSRGITAAETQANSWSPTHDRASMEPRHHCRGNPLLALAPAVDHGASMEPRHHCRGNVGSWAAVRPRVRASMEPRHHCRGNIAAGSASDARSRLQWSRGITAAETIANHPRTVHLTASMEPRHHCRGKPTPRTRNRYLGAALQWSRGITAAETPASTSRLSHAIGFNGAAASLPRKPGRDGPQQDCCVGFNGAAASLPRKPSRARIAATSSASLQWSRGITAAETPSLTGPAKQGTRKGGCERGSQAASGQRVQGR